ncbi:MAG: Pvc16 family protein [Croceibacterium sp.]
MPTADLALVSRSLKGLLTANIERLAGSAAPAVKVSIGYPEDQTGASRTINLHLYHVAEDQFCRNLPGASGTADVATAPMSLSLFYLMTAHHTAVAGKAEVEQTIMGQALKTMHDFALIRSDTVVADGGGILSPVLLPGIDDGTTTLEIVLRPLTPEDALSYWASEQQQPVRLSAYYEVRLVQLEPEAPTMVSAPVLSVGQWVGPKPAVSLANSRSAIRFARPAAIGDTLPERIEISPARPFIDLPPIDADFTEENRFWLSGGGFTSGIRRRLVLIHPDLAAAGLPKGEIVLPAADPPAALADARWGVAFSPDRVDVAVCPRLANPLGGPPINLQPGTYRIRAEIVLADQTTGTTTREIVRRSNEVSFQLAPRIRDAQAPVLVPGDPMAAPPANEDRQRVTIRLSPNFSLTDSLTVDLAIDGKPYRRVTNFTAVPADNDAAFRVLSSSVVVQPDFDLAATGLHVVRLTVNGVDAQPFWLETGP